MFVRAVRQQKRLRMALHGPSGSGKTYTALELAKGLGNSVALIDTERGSASLYADKFAFDVIELDYFSVDNYISGLTEAAEAGYDVVIIDSLSHAWTGLGGVLDAVNNTKGNTFTEGWGKVGTPQQNRLMDAILKAPFHVIVTLRVKTDYEVEKDERGKSIPKKVGLAPIQRDGVEYEFDIVASLSIDNTLTIEKSRMIDLAGKMIAKPDRKLGHHILAWLNSGKAPEPRINPEDAPVFRRILDEEMARMKAWFGSSTSTMAASRSAIVECYKAVKGVATSIDLQMVVAQNPATPSMNPSQVLQAADAIAKACDAALPKELFSDPKEHEVVSGDKPAEPSAEPHVTQQAEPTTTPVTAPATTTPVDDLPGPGGMTQSEAAGLAAAMDADAAAPDQWKGIPTEDEEGSGEDPLQAALPGKPGESAEPPARAPVTTTATPAPEQRLPGRNVGDVMNVYSYRYALACDTLAEKGKTVPPDLETDDLFTLMRATLDAEQQAGIVVPEAQFTPTVWEKEALRAAMTAAVKHVDAKAGIRVRWYLSSKGKGQAGLQHLLDLINRDRAAKASKGLIVYYPTTSEEVLKAYGVSKWGELSDELHIEDLLKRMA